MICHFCHSSDKQSNTSSLLPNRNSCIIILLHSILIIPSRKTCCSLYEPIKNPGYTQLWRHIFSYLVEIFPGEEGLVAGVFLQQGGEGEGFLALLPGFAAAVSLQRVVDDVVVVGVFPRQDAGSTGAAQRAGDELRGEDGGQRMREGRGPCFKLYKVMVSAFIY